MVQRQLLLHFVLLPVVLITCEHQTAQILHLGSTYHARGVAVYQYP